MKFPMLSRWIACTTPVVVGAYMLGLAGMSSAAPRESNQPFANSVEQRAEMVTQLREIAALLKEQNALLKSGKLRVVVDEKGGR